MQSFIMFSPFFVYFQVLIQNQLDTLHTEFQNLLQHEKKDDLGRMYQLVARLEDALGDMKNFLEAHICTQGLNALDELGESAQSVNSHPYLHIYKLIQLI